MNYESGVLELSAAIQTTRCSAATIILEYIQDGEIEQAKIHFSNEGDKLPKLHTSIVKKMLGCRTHGVHNCQEVFCKW